MLALSLKFDFYEESVTPFLQKLKKGIDFYEGQLLMIVSQVNVIKNIQGIKTCGGVFYTIKDLIG